MSYDVFLSYARVDVRRARSLQRGLESLGLTVFFDLDVLGSEDDFAAILEQEVRNSGVVISAWTTHALSREWVRRECETALAFNTLIAVDIGPVSPNAVSPEWSRLLRFDLQGFDGAGPHAGWHGLVGALAATLDKPSLSAAYPDRIEIGRALAI